MFHQPTGSATRPEKGWTISSSVLRRYLFSKVTRNKEGLQFNSVWSVGNAKQIGVEDVLQFTWMLRSRKDSHLKLLSILKMFRIRTGCYSMLRLLIRKGCKIAAIKAGSSGERKPGGVFPYRRNRQFRFGSGALFRKRKRGLARPFLCEGELL